MAGPTSTTTMIPFEDHAWPSTTWLGHEADSHNGSCHTCRRRAVQCDGNAPHCRTCIDDTLQCAGYGVKLHWLVSLSRKHRRRASSTSLWSERSSPGPPRGAAPQLPSPRSFSSLGLPQSENFFMQHYLKNVTRTTIAIDYYQNGYRSLSQAGINDPSMLNSVLAVAASHHSKWNGSNDSDSRPYLRKTFASLKLRLQDPKLVYTEGTIVSMLNVLSYEIFNGAYGWAPHYKAVIGWLAARGNCDDLDPFVKTWIAMVVTQNALNLGGSITHEVDRWLESSWTSNSTAIDPFFGCSVRLPRLMAAAARLFEMSQSSPGDRPLTTDKIRPLYDKLQTQIKATKMDLCAEPALAVSCHSQSLDQVAMEDLNHKEHFRRIVAAAEIFRLAAHIYVFRTIHEPEGNPSEEVQASIDEMFHLLAHVPDALGPGSNLGWCLTVLGAELDLPEQREYIRCRLQGIRSLGMNNPDSAERVLETVWMQRDLHRQGACHLQRWQIIMRSLGEGQILV